MQKILIVDDEPFVLNLFKKFFNYIGRDAIFCEDGASACAKFDEYKDEISIAIIDVNMPDIDGIELAQKIKHCCPHILVFISTGDDIDLETINKTADNPIDGLLHKPFTIKNLQEILSKVE